MIEGHGIPDANTPGNIGSFYRDLDTNTLYKCTGMISEPVQKQFVSVRSHVPTTQYAWEEEGEEAQNVTFGEVSGSMNTVAADFVKYVTEIVIPEGATKLNHNTPEEGVNPCAFHEFENLKKITLPASMDPVPEFVLNDGDTWAAPYTDFEVVLSPGITTINSNAFAYTEIGKITIPDTVTSIGSCAFECCNLLTEIEIPSSVTSIASSAFLDAGLTKIIINKSEGSIEGASDWGEGIEIIWNG